MNLQGKRVLVTGGEGFLGKHLCAALTAKGADLAVPRSADYDLVEPRQTCDLFDDVEPHAVFHLAARVGGIGANQRNPGRFFYENLAMGLNVLEESMRHGVEKLVNVATVCGYPKHCPVPFREVDLWNGYPEETNAPYGLAKKMLLVGAQAYRQQYGLSAITLFPANLYGPGDNFDPETSHAIPAIIRKVYEARESGAPEVVLWGSGTPTREFLFVDDCVRALVLAAEGYDSPEPCNIGNGKEVFIRYVAEKIADIMGYAGKIVFDKTKPDGQPRRCLDVSRAKAFGFEAEVSLDVGLRKTVAYYEAGCEVLETERQEASRLSEDFA